MTREEAYEKLESVVGQYLVREDGPISIHEFRHILSVLKGETNSTNLTVDDWNADEISVLKFMVRCGYDMIDYNMECGGNVRDFSRNDMYNLCCKLGIEDVT